MIREWKDTDNDCHYFYNSEDGKIVGMVHNIVHTKIWLAKIIFNHNDEKYLGQFITKDFSKASVERYWDIEDRTLIESK